MRNIALRTVLRNLGALTLVLSLNLTPAAAAAQEAYFSPNGHIKNRIVDEIANAKDSIDIAVFNITSFAIGTALKKAWKKGLRIRILADQGESEDLHSIIGSLMQNGLRIKLVKGRGKNGLMHNKFAVFDHQLLLTGSYNWTETAEHANYENAVFLRDKDLLKAYQNEFDLIWSKN